MLLTPLNHRRDFDFEPQMSNRTLETIERFRLTRSKSGLNCQNDLLGKIDTATERIKSANSQYSESTSPTVNGLPKANKQHQLVGQKVQGTNRRIISKTNDNSHLVEIEAEATLYFYGSKSLDELDSQLASNVTTTVTTISFNYIDFEYIAKFVIKIRNKFANLSVSRGVRFVEGVSSMGLSVFF